MPSAAEHRTGAGKQQEPAADAERRHTSGDIEAERVEDAERPQDQQSGLDNPAGKDDDRRALVPRAPRHAQRQPPGERIDQAEQEPQEHDPRCNAEIAQHDLTRDDRDRRSVRPQPETDDGDNQRQRRQGGIEDPVHRPIAREDLPQTEQDQRGQQPGRDEDGDQ